MQAAAALAFVPKDAFSASTKQGTIALGAEDVSLHKGFCASHKRARTFDRSVLPGQLHTMNFWLVHKEALHRVDVLCSRDEAEITCSKSNLSSMSSNPCISGNRACVNSSAVSVRNSVGSPLARTTAFRLEVCADHH